MSKPKPIPAEDYGVVDAQSTLTIQRLLPGPIERVWAYLTESDLRRKWLAAGDMQPKAGTPFTFTWRNDELATPPSKRPEGFGSEHSMQSEIVEIDPPRKIVFTWADTGNVAIQLEPKGGKVLLTLTHSRLPSRDYMGKVGPGWHAHLDVLAASVAGTEAEPFWDHFVRLRKEYAARLPA